MKNTPKAESIAIILIAISLLSSGAHAATIYQESVDGDAPPVSPTGSIPTLNFPVTPNVLLGAIPVGTSTILGSVEGGTVDNVDIFEFTFATQWHANLTAIDLGGNNPSTAFRLHTSAATTLEASIGLFYATTPTNDIFSVNDPGTYRISVFEFGSTSPSSYSLDLVGVPEPSSSLLLGLGILGVVIRRHRNR